MASGQLLSGYLAGLVCWAVISAAMGETFFCVRVACLLVLNAFSIACLARWAADRFSALMASQAAAALALHSASETSVLTVGRVLAGTRSSKSATRSSRDLSGIGVPCGER